MIFVCNKKLLFNETLGWIMTTLIKKKNLLTAKKRRRGLGGMSGEGRIHGGEGQEPPRFGKLVDAVLKT